MKRSKNKATCEVLHKLCQPWKKTKATLVTQNESEQNFPTLICFILVIVDNDLHFNITWYTLKTKKNCGQKMKKKMINFFISNKNRKILMSQFSKQIYFLCSLQARVDRQAKLVHCLVAWLLGTVTQGVL